jgi:tetratricopeptide (TPR) repeat protein
MRQHLGQALFYAGKAQEAIHHFNEAVRLDPNNAEAHYSIALALATQGYVDRTLEHYARAMELRPSVDRSPVLHYLLGMKYAEARRFHEAVLATQKALDLARAAGDQRSAQEIGERLKLYKQLDSSSNR